MPYNHVVVTGGLGFIGSELAELFLQLGSAVTIVDARISNVTHRDYFERRFQSVRVVEDTVARFLQSDLSSRDCDLLVHAAGLVGPAGILKYAGSIATEIVSCTSAVIEHCIADNIPLVYFSSSEVYGKSGHLSENSDIRVPPYYNARIEYALAKLSCEAMITNSQSRGLKALIIRPFNVVGPRQSRMGGFVLPTFVQQALGGKPITVFGSGKQTRSFISVRDLAMFVAMHATTELMSVPRPLNVGNPANVISIEELGMRVIELLESTSQIQYVDPQSIYGPLYHEAESVEKVCDITSAAALGWSPTWRLDDIIVDTADFYRKNRDTGNADARD